MRAYSYSTPNGVSNRSWSAGCAEHHDAFCRLGQLAVPLPYGRRPRRPGYEAKGMPGRVGEHLSCQPTSSELENAWASVRDVVDHDVEVKLLRPLGIRPPRRLVIRGTLECDSGTHIVGGNHDPVVSVVGNRQAEELRVKSRKRSWIGTVDYHVMKSPNHEKSLVAHVRHELWPSVPNRSSGPASGPARGAPGSPRSLAFGGPSPPYRASRGRSRTCTPRAGDHSL
jgi:hypothetical protein